MSMTTGGIVSLGVERDRVHVSEEHTATNAKIPKTGEHARSLPSSAKGYKDHHAGGKLSLLRSQR